MSNTDAPNEFHCLRLFLEYTLASGETVRLDSTARWQAGYTEWEIDAWQTQLVTPDYQYLDVELTDELRALLTAEAWRVWRETDWDAVWAEEQARRDEEDEVAFQQGWDAYHDGGLF